MNPDSRTCQISEFFSGSGCLAQRGRGCADRGDDPGVEVWSLRDFGCESASFCGEKGVEGTFVQFIGHMNWTRQLGVWFPSGCGCVVEQLEEHLEELARSGIDLVEHVIDDVVL